MSERAVVAALVGASLAATGCGPDWCGQRCGVAGECPSGLVCDAARDRCLPEGDRAACDGLGDPAEPDAAPAPGSGDAHDPGRAEAADGDANAERAAPLDIRIASPSDSCEGDAVSIELVATGGDGATYHWQSSAASASFTPSEGEGARFTLVGAPAGAGRLELSVSLEDGSSRVERAITLVVHERPRLAPLELPALCPGELVDHPLAGEGGDASSYRYAAALDPALGLRVEGARLVGRVQPPSLASPVSPSALAGGSSSGAEASSTPRLELAVSDAYCEGSPREMPLDVLPAGSASCPQILASTSAGPSTALPPPCLGSEYAQPFIAMRGGAAALDVTWREVAVAPGLRFDAATRRLAGTPLGAGVVTLELGEASGRRIQADFPAAPRTRCWLAYLAERGGSRRLSLFDARLRDQPAARRSYPLSGDAGVDADVLDFAFSPGGRFSSYRVASSEGPTTLRLLDLRTWRERALVFDGSVLEYAWSGADDAGAVLAVAFEREGGGALGGVRVFPAPVDETAAAPRAASSAPDDSAGPLGGFELGYLEPALAVVRSDLLWLPGDRVAFLTEDAAFAAARLFQSARFDSDAVTVLAPRDRLEFFDDALLMGAASGAFVIEPSVRQAQFFASDGAREVSHVPDVIAPSGAFTARAEDGVLRVFRATDSSAEAGDRAWAEAPGCSALLAWARGRERIACAVTDGDTERIAFFDLDTERARLVEVARALGEPVFLAEQHVGQPRLFSEAGGRFAIATDASVDVVSLDGGAPHVELDSPAGLLSGAPVQLSFSPHGGFLAAHAGSSLAVWNLRADRQPFGRIASTLRAPSACGEDFSARPAAWCGSAANEGPTRWSADDDLLVFVDASGALAIEDLSLGFPRQGQLIAVDAACGEGCIVSGSHQFQR